MIEQEIAPAGPNDRGRVLSSLEAAFRADPVVRHLFPDDATYPQYAAAFFGHLFDKRLARNTVWTIDGGSSVAMWDVPGTGTTEEEEKDTTALEHLPAAERGRLEAYDEIIHAALPRHPFWYLGLLGTHPDHRGKRWGRALIADGVGRATAAGLPAVLETSNPANVGVYQRAGFAVVGEITHGSVRVWVMESPV